MAVERDTVSPLLSPCRCLAADILTVNGTHKPNFCVWEIPTPTFDIEANRGLNNHAAWNSLPEHIRAEPDIRVLGNC